MLRFILTTILSFALALALYSLGAMITSGNQSPGTIAYTTSTSLNHSLKRNRKGVAAYVVGSSIAMRNIDAEVLTQEMNMKFSVISGLGLKPLETIEVISRTGIKNSTVIIPICVLELQKFGAPSNLDWNQFRIKNVADFLNDRKILAIPKNQGGQIRFNEYGNAFFPSCENGMVMPPTKHAIMEPMDIGHESINSYLHKIREIITKNKLNVHIVLTPYSTNYRSSGTNQYGQIFEEFFRKHESDSLHFHNFSYDETDFEKFVDFVHMTEIGAQSFTRDIAWYLKGQCQITKDMN